VTRDDCFVGVAAIFSRLRVSIRKVSRAGMSPSIFDPCDCAENRRQDAGATRACSARRGAVAAIVVRFNIFFEAL
jgi:hypothetical protein